MKILITHTMEKSGSHTHAHNTTQHKRHNLAKLGVGQSRFWPKSAIPLKHSGQTRFWPKSVLAKVGHTTKTLTLAKVGLAKVGLAKVGHDLQGFRGAGFRCSGVQGLGFRMKVVCVVEVGLGRIIVARIKEQQVTASAPDTPNVPLAGGLEGHGTVDSGGFPGFTANPQHTCGPSWSVRLPATPRSVGPAVFLGSPPTHNTRQRKS